jgi:hypothetical protein
MVAAATVLAGRRFQSLTVRWKKEFLYVSLHGSFLEKAMLASLTSYTAIVRPTIEYTATVWDPTNQSKIKALENIQRRAARFVTNNYTDRTPGCVTNMITSLGWQSLEQRRQNSRLCMLCKIQHNLIDNNRDLYIRHSDSRTKLRCSLSHWLSSCSLLSSF